MVGTGDRKLKFAVHLTGKVKPDNDRMQQLREFNAAGPPTTANVIQRAAIGEAGQGATCSAAASAEAVRWPPGAAPARAEALGTGPGEKSREDARTATFWRTVGGVCTPVSLANASIVASGRGAVVLPHTDSRRRAG